MSEYQKVPMEALPRDSKGNSLHDLYICMPTSQKYIRYIAAGDAIDESKLHSVKMHPVPELFRKVIEEPQTAKAPDPEIPKEFQEKILGKALQSELDDVYKFIARDKADPETAVKRFEGMADNLVGTIAPDVKALTEHLRRQAQYIALMSDAAAMSTLAIICAYANGFDSRKSYRELSYATLVMDISLAEFSEEQVKQYYMDRDQLPPDVLKAIQLHPMRSYQLAEQKLKSLSDVTMQLILNHHELFNGKGFPRSIRTEALFPIARVLSLAVDAFERLKKAQLTGAKTALMDIFAELRDEQSEAHLRRHNKKFVDAVILFLSKEAATGAPAA
jgi:response regulator RpfG family c-di-GMP phosphodiesterase